MRRSGVGRGAKAVMIVVGIGECGHRQIFDIWVEDSENEASAGLLFRDLKERGLRGVRYSVSNDHEGLVRVLQRHFQNVLWQRCRAHFIRDFAGKSKGKEVPNYLHKLQNTLATPDMQESRTRKDHLVEELADSKPQVASRMDEEIESCFSVYFPPESHRRGIKSAICWSSSIRNQNARGA